MTKSQQLIFTIPILFVVAFIGIKLSAAEAQTFFDSARYWTSAEQYQTQCDSFQTTAQWVRKAFY